MPPTPKDKPITSAGFRGCLAPFLALLFIVGGAIIIMCSSLVITGGVEAVDVVISRGALIAGIIGGGVSIIVGLLLAVFGLYRSLPKSATIEAKRAFFRTIAYALFTLFFWLFVALVSAVQAVGENFKDVVVKAANKEPSVFWLIFVLMATFGLIICYSIISRAATKRVSSESAAPKQTAAATSQPESGKAEATSTALRENPLSSNP
jgi:hypothetical protein